MNELSVEPAWVSTIEHVERVGALIAQASWFAKLTGRYHLPKNLPYVSTMGPLGSSRMPMVMLANGALDVRPRQIAFRASPLRLSGVAAHGLDDGLAFALEAGEVLGIERYRGQSPLGDRFDLVFSRIVTRRPGMLGDFLLCVGGVGPRVDRVREQSQQLFVALRQAMFT
ncbi:MAG TPA: hypothetical protein VGE07_09535 [Herpetosiphonaceae bacterium]